MGNFTFIETEIPGLVIIEPKVFGDDRGFFMETWQQEEFEKAGISGPFVQDNHSKSRKGVLRGLHFQRENTQGKLVRVLSGTVFDVGIDLRPNSPTFGQWHGVELSGENRRQFYVPPGFGHGFLVTSDEAEFVYKCTDYYNPGADGGVIWNDSTLNIQWPVLDVDFTLSEKDQKLPGLQEQDFRCFERWFTP